MFNSGIGQNMIRNHPNSLNLHTKGITDVLCNNVLEIIIDYAPFLILLDWIDSKKLDWVA